MVNKLVNNIDNKIWKEFGEYCKDNSVKIKIGEKLSEVIKDYLNKIENDKKKDKP